MNRFYSIVPAIAFAILATGIVLPSPANAATTEEASQYLNNIGTQAINIISDKQAGKDQKQAKLETLFSDNVDIPWVGKFVMGRFWRQATDDQKARYLHEYERFLIKHYTSRFSDYSSGSFKITGSKNDGENEFTVSMQIQGTDGKSEPVMVDYRIRKEEAAFKIFDIAVEGVSLITTQRSEFSSVISNNSIDYLIDQLAKRKELSFPDKKD